MKSGYQRSIEEDLKRTVSRIIRHDLQVERSDLLSVNRVRLRGDGQTARVLVSHIKEEHEEGVKQKLNDREPEIRRKVMEALPLKRIPMLSFEVDQATREARRVHEILDDLHSDPA